MAGIKRFIKIRTQDEDLNKMQERVEAAFQPIFNSEIVNGVFLEEINLVTGSDNIIEHKLGRKVRGYIVVSKSANSNVYDKINDASDTTNKNFYLNLQCSANVTVNLWIF